jgi:hypothetical protein
MHIPQSHLVRQAVMRDLAAGRDVYIRPRQLPLECLSVGEAPAGMERRLPRNTGGERTA